MFKRIVVFVGIGLVVAMAGCKQPVDLFDFPPYQRDKKSLVVLLTAVWNEYSGETGQPNFVAAARDTFGAAVVPIAAHAATTGDPNYSLAASQFYSLYEAEGFPELGLNTTGFGFRLEDWILATRAAAFDTTGGIAGPAKPKLVMAISKKVNGTDLQMKIRVRFEEAMSEAALNLALYITENDVVGYQAGALQLEITHQYILRGSATPGAWGVLLGNGTYQRGQIIEYETSFPINNFMNANNLIVNGVVYRMENQQPVEVLNANFR